MKTATQGPGLTAVRTALQAIGIEADHWDVNAVGGSNDYSAVMHGNWKVLIYLRGQLSAAFWQQYRALELAQGTHGESWITEG